MTWVGCRVLCVSRASVAADGRSSVAPGPRLAPGSTVHAPVFAARWAAQPLGARAWPRVHVRRPGPRFTPDPRHALMRRDRAPRRAPTRPNSALRRSRPRPTHPRRRAAAARAASCARPSPRHPRSHSPRGAHRPQPSARVARCRAAARGRPEAAGEGPEGPPRVHQHAPAEDVVAGAADHRAHAERQGLADERRAPPRVANVRTNDVLRRSRRGPTMARGSVFVTISPQYPERETPRPDACAASCDTRSTPLCRA